MSNVVAEGTQEPQKLFENGIYRGQFEAFFKNSKVEKISTQNGTIETNPTGVFFTYDGNEYETVFKNLKNIQIGSHSFSPEQLKPVFHQD